MQIEIDNGDVAFLKEKFNELYQKIKPRLSRIDADNQGIYVRDVKESSDLQNDFLFYMLRRFGSDWDNLSRDAYRLEDLTVQLKIQNK